MRWTGSPATRRSSTASTAFSVSGSITIVGLLIASARVVPETCSTSRRASSAASCTPASLRRRRASRRRSESVAGSADETTAAFIPSRLRMGNRAAWLTRSIFPFRGQQPGLVIRNQRVDDFVKLALHYPVELVEREVDAMVGEPSLRKIVGADAL